MPTPTEALDLAEWWDARLQGLSDAALAALQRILRGFSAASPTSALPDEQKHRLALWVCAQVSNLDRETQLEVQWILASLAQKMLAEADRLRGEDATARPSGRSH